MLTNQLTDEDGNDSKMPTVEWTCPTCGKPCYEVSDSYYVTVYQCRVHGKWRKSRAGQWTIEHID